jgi:hypothetical protein
MRLSVDGKAIDHVETAIRLSLAVVRNGPVRFFRGVKTKE